MRRLATWGALVLGAVYFGIAVYLSSLAPCGTWTNTIFGEAMWSHRDPGGLYVALAHELPGRDTALSHPAHPAIPLQLLLFAQQWLFLQVGGAPSPRTHAGRVKPTWGSCAR